MEVQYVGFTEKPNGKKVYLMKNIKNGMCPVLIKGKYGLESPYVTNKVFDAKLSDCRFGDFVEIVVDYEVGDTISIVDGPLENFTGVVEAIDREKDVVRVTISMLGRETSVELELDQVERLD